MVSLQELSQVSELIILRQRRMHSLLAGLAALGHPGCCCEILPRLAPFVDAKCILIAALHLSATYTCVYWRQPANTLYRQLQDHALQQV